MIVITQESINEREYLDLPIAAQVAVDEAVEVYTNGGNNVPSDILDTYVGMEATEVREEAMQWTFDSLAHERKPLIAAVERTSCGGRRKCEWRATRRHSGKILNNWIRCYKHRAAVEDITNRSWAKAGQMALKAHPELFAASEQEQKQWHKLANIVFKRSPHKVSVRPH